MAMGHHGPAGFGCRVYSRNPLSIDRLRKSFSNNIHNNEPPATLHYAVLTASLIYESQVRCQAHVSFWGTRRLYTPHDDFLLLMTSENDLAMLDG